MHPVKNQNSPFSVYLLITFLILSSCNVYNTLRVDDISNTSLASLHERQKTVVIHDNRETQEFILTNFKVENDSLKGFINPSPAGKKHPHHKKYFRPSQVDIYAPLSVMHVYSRSNILSTGHFGIPISSIRFVEIHEGDSRKSIGRTFGAIAGGAAIILVGIIVISTI